MGKKIRTRFAPSPTGPLHIGGVRTALFSYLFAKKHGGDFILRIEDTDQTRFVPESEQYILDSLNWLGITPDEGPNIGGAYGPYRQSERKSIYGSYAHRLVKEKKAYYAFDTPEALDKMRSKLKGTKAAPKYNSIVREIMQNSLTLGEEEVSCRLEAKEPYVVRLLIDPKKEVKFYDEVRGWIKVEGSNLDDKILLKADGMPTYHLASVVDDHLMKISHIIRGDEWLPSTPIHALLYQAFGWEMPIIAHLPLLLRSDGSGKLSKRFAEKSGTPILPINWKDPKTGITYPGFREAGYLRDGLLNFLALLGWHDRGDRELFTQNELIETFSLECINKSGVRFDMQKAKWVNKQHIRKLSNKTLIERYLLPDLQSRGISANKDYAEKVIALIKERIEFPDDIIRIALPFFKKPNTKLTISDKDKLQSFLPILIKDLKTLREFTRDDINNIIIGSIVASGKKKGEVVPLLRVLLTGEKKGANIIDCIELLGKDEVIARLY